MIVLDELILQTKLFLEENIGVESLSVESAMVTINELSFQKYISMIGVGGEIDLITVMSFDDLLLDKCIAVFMGIQEIPQDKIDEITQSITGEIVNIILGMTLCVFPNQGKGLNITPPIPIKDSEALKIFKNSKIVHATIDTNFGNMTISVFT